jgi:hypothetical protein
MRNAEYGGPNSLVDEADRYKGVVSANSEAQEQSEASKSEGGRKALLDKNYGTGAGRYDYTPGQKNLDNLLVQNDPSSRQAFESAQKNAEASGQRLQGLKEQLQGYAGQGKATTAATRASTRSALGVDNAGNIISENGTPNSGAIGSLYGTLSSQAKERQQDYDKTVADARSAVANKDLSSLTPREREMLNAQLPGEQGYYRINPSDYVQAASRDDINLGSVASKAQAAQMDALSQLTDQGTNPYLDSSRAETAPSEYAKFDQGGFQGAIDASRSGFEGQQNTLNSQIQTIWNTPTPVTGYGNPVAEKQAAVQAKYDELNQLRASYGLPPVANPYVNGVPYNPMPLGTNLDPTSGNTTRVL